MQKPVACAEEPCVWPRGRPAPLKQGLMKNLYRYKLSTVIFNYSKLLSDKNGNDSIALDSWPSKQFN